MLLTPSEFATPIAGRSVIAAGPWVGLQKRFAQSRSGKMRVDLRRRQVLVPQQLLHDPDPRPTVEQMSCEAVAERMG
jgi:hypothetical protein